MNKYLIVFIFMWVFAFFAFAQTNYYGVNQTTVESEPVIIKQAGFVEGLVGAAAGGSVPPEEENSYILQNDQTDLDFINRSAGSDNEIDGNPDRPVIQGSVPNAADGEIMEHEASVIGEPIRAKAVEVRGWDPQKKEEFLGTVKEIAEVQSGQDLEHFAQGVLLRDENITEVSVDEDQAGVQYRMPAKLFGFINSSLIVTAEVGTGGRVKVKYPWLRFFFSKPVNADELERSMQADIDTDEEMVAYNKLHRLQRAAQTLQTMSNLMKTKHDAAMSTIQNTR